MTSNWIQLINLQSSFSSRNVPLIPSSKIDKRIPSEIGACPLEKYIKINKRSLDSYILDFRVLKNWVLHTS